MKRDQQATCEGKKALTYEIARMIAKRKKRGFYKCPWCRRWHVGDRL